LTQKLAMLLALTSAARAHEICFLDTSLLVKYHTGYTFHFRKFTKVATRSKPRPPIKFSHFQNKNLCVCFHIDLYLKRSVSWRSQGESQLLLSFVNPHKPVKPCTVSKWIIEVLSAAEIDTSTFKGH